MQLAHLARDLHDLSGGRFALGLGSQTRAQIERRFGVPFDKPVARMRELVAAMQAIFTSWQDGTRLDFRGDYYTHTLMPPLFDPGPSEHGAPPVWLGALGPRMTAMAAEVADGLLVMPFHTRRSLAELTRPNLEIGLDRAGRCARRPHGGVRGDPLHRPGRGRARDRRRRGPHPGRLLRRHARLPSGPGGPRLGRAPDRSPRVVQAGEVVGDGCAGRRRGAGRARRSAGTPKEVAAEIADRYEGFADRVAVYFPYASSPDLVADVAAAVTSGARLVTAADPAAVTEWEAAGRRIEVDGREVFVLDVPADGRGDRPPGARAPRLPVGVVRLPPRARRAAPPVAGCSSSTSSASGSRPSPTSATRSSSRPT